MCIYIYIYIERERDIYIYIYTDIDIEVLKRIEILELHELLVCRFQILALTQHAFRLI